MSFAVRVGSQQHEYALARAPDPNLGMFESGDEEQTHASLVVMIDDKIDEVSVACDKLNQ